MAVQTQTLTAPDDGGTGILRTTRAVLAPSAAVIEGWEVGDLLFTIRFPVGAKIYAVGWYAKVPGGFDTGMRFDLGFTNDATYFLGNSSLMLTSGGFGTYNQYLSTLGPYVVTDPDDLFQMEVSVASTPPAGAEVNQHFLVHYSGT